MNLLKRWVCLEKADKYGIKLVRFKDGKYGVTKTAECRWGGEYLGVQLSDLFFDSPRWRSCVHTFVRTWKWVAILHMIKAIREDAAAEAFAQWEDARREDTGTPVDLGGEER